jgi:penicillin-binding protein 1A
LRQPGSSFKPYVYAAAVDAGILDKNTTVTDKSTCIGNWCPHNYKGGFKGSMPAWSAMAQSINTIPVQLSIQLGKEASSVKSGRAKIVDIAHQMGVKSDLYDAQCMPIGCVELTALDQAVGYNTLANGGYRVKPYAIVQIRNTNGELIYTAEPEKIKVLSERVVSNLNFMLNKVIDQGTGVAAKIQGQTIAGKTGTTNAYKDAWFVGYTGSMVASIWMGNDDNSSSNNMTGGTLPARTWKLIMEEALKTQPAKAPAYLNAAPIVNNTKTNQPTKKVEKMGEPLSLAPQNFDPPAPPVVRERNFLEKLFNIGDKNE